MDDESDAIRRLKNNDIGGLETLVNRYQVKAVRTAFLVVHDEQLAQDIVQETFLRIFLHIRRFDENRPFGPYLLRSVVNAALDAARREKKQQAFDGDLETLDRLIQYAMTVEAQAEFNAVKQDIRLALEALSPRQRAVVVLRYYLEMSETEMADQLDIRPGTVKWLLNAARSRLRVWLSKKWSKE